MENVTYTEKGQDFAPLIEQAIAELGYNGVYEVDNDQTGQLGFFVPGDHDLAELDAAMHLACKPLDDVTFNHLEWSDSERGDDENGCYVTFCVEWAV